MTAADRIEAHAWDMHAGHVPGTWDEAEALELEAVTLRKELRAMRAETAQQLNVDRLWNEYLRLADDEGLPATDSRRRAALDAYVDAVDQLNIRTREWLGR